MAGLLSKERITAPADYNRWHVPVASVAIHLCIGSVYAWSIYNPPLTRIQGVVTSAADDWSLSAVVWVFTVAIVSLGLAAAFAGKWLEEAGPRKVGVVAAFCWGGGYIVGGLGILTHQPNDRKVFDLAARMENPINLSIGQPDFEVPKEVREAYVDAAQSGKNGYALTQGMPVLLEKLQAQIDQEYGAGNREAFVCSGTSGGLVLALLTLVNPGEEVIIFDPYFVMYTSLVKLVGGW